VAASGLVDRHALAEWLFTSPLDAIRAVCALAWAGAVVGFSRVGKRTQISSNPDRAESVSIKEKQNNPTITEQANPRPTAPKPGGRGERAIK